MKRSIAPIRKNRPSVLVWKGLAWERKKEDWLAPVAAGVVTSDCGKRENPLLHKQELHDGLDIAVPQGTEVVAVKSGTVTEVRTSATYGKLLRFETTDGYTILYAHLSEILVGQGRKSSRDRWWQNQGIRGFRQGRICIMEFIGRGSCSIRWSICRRGRRRSEDKRKTQ